MPHPQLTQEELEAFAQEMEEGLALGAFDDIFDEELQAHLWSVLDNRADQEADAD